MMLIGTVGILVIVLLLVTNVIFMSMLKNWAKKRDEYYAKQFEKIEINNKQFLKEIRTIFIESKEALENIRKWAI